MYSETTRSITVTVEQDGGGGVIFANGFESGDLTAWSGVN